MKCFTSIIEIFSLTVILNILNSHYRTIATRNSFKRFYISSGIFILPFASPLTLLHFFFFILTIYSLLPLCTGRQNISTNRTAIYISTIVSCNIIFHPQFYTYVTTCYTLCPLIFIPKMQRYFLSYTFFICNTTNRDFFA